MMLSCLSMKRVYVYCERVLLLYQARSYEAYWEERRIMREPRFIDLETWFFLRQMPC
jgi:hypothetical protein